jgi:hypothetical protein
MEFNYAITKYAKKPPHNEFFTFLNSLFKVVTVQEDWFYWRRFLYFNKRCYKPVGSDRRGARAPKLFSKSKVNKKGETL